MTLDTELKACMKAIRGCTGAGLVDLNSGFVLGMQSKARMTENEVDALGAAAVELFSTETARAAAGALEAPFSTAVIAGHQGQHLFRRLDGRPDEVLCVMLGPKAKTAAVLEALPEQCRAVEEAGIW